MARSAARGSSPRLFDNLDAAPVIGVEPATLGNPRWRRKHRVPFRKIGRLVRYDVEELRQWADARRAALRGDS
jgi:hypothetical protein